MTPTAQQIRAKAAAYKPKDHDHVAHCLRKAFEVGAFWAARHRARKRGKKT